MGDLVTSRVTRSPIIHFLPSDQPQGMHLVRQWQRAPLPRYLQAVDLAASPDDQFQHIGAIGDARRQHCPDPASTHFRTNLSVHFPAAHITDFQDHVLAVTE